MNLGVRVIVRTDLGFTPGLMAAQVSHLVMEQIRQHVLSGDVSVKANNPDLYEWMKDPYLFVHGVGNKESLEFFLVKAKTAQLKTYEWRDTVYVTIGDRKEALTNVLVGFSFEACDADRVRAVIGNLPML